MLIMCLTCYPVHQCKSRIPERDGVEPFRVDTIHGVLNYTRKGADSKVTRTPPFALRCIDFILCDEGSQYEESERERLFSCMREQPHKPFTVVVAEFQQLQPVGANACATACRQSSSRLYIAPLMRTASLFSMVSLTRAKLQEYLAERHWKKRD